MSRLSSEEELIAENDRLRAALKPFAEAAAFFAEHRERMRPDQELLNHETIGASAIITLADLQRAAAALKTR